LACFLLLGSVPESVSAGEVRVAVAANFAGCLDRLAHAFEKSTGHDLIISAGSTGKHYAQIKAGAPFDVFFAADAERPALLVEAGLAFPDSRFTYAIGRLVLWMPMKKEDPDLKIDARLRSPDYRHLALANPRLAPYGRAAKQALTSLGLWEELEPRLVMGQSVGQVWQFVATGNAEMGFVALAQCLGAADPGSWQVIDADLHDPIEQQVVLLRSAADNDAASQFLDFIRQPENRLLIENCGYTVPED
jgi:molybdate transport system substrate-binding protein